MDYKPKPGAKVDAAHSNNIWSLCWTSQGKIATGALDGQIKIWSVKDSTELKFEGSSVKKNTGISSLTSVSDGSVLLACYQDSNIKMYSTENLQEISSINPGILEAYSITISPDDAVIVSGNHKGYVNVWSMGQGHEKIAQLDTTSQSILSTTFNLDGLLATASVDGIVNIFDLETKQIIHKINEHSLPVRCVRFSTDGNLLFMASDDRRVSVYDTVSCQTFTSFSLPSMARSVDASHDRRHFVVGCSDGSISYWDLGMRKRVVAYEIHKDQVWSVGFNKSASAATQFASVGDDGALQLYQ